MTAFLTCKEVLERIEGDDCEKRTVPISMKLGSVATWLKVNMAKRSKLGSFVQ